MDQVKTEKIELERRRGQVALKNQIETEVRKKKDHIAELDEELKDFTNDMTRGKDELDRLEGVKHEVERINIELTNSQTAQAHLIKAKEKIREQIESNGGEFLDDDSNDDLQQWVEKLRMQDGQQNDDLNRQKQVVGRKNVERQAKEDALRKKEDSKIRLEYEATSYKTNLQRREECGSDLVRKLGIQDAGMDVTESCFEYQAAKQETFTALKDSNRQQLESVRKDISQNRNKVENKSMKVSELQESTRQEEAELKSVRPPPPPPPPRRRTHTTPCQLVSRGDVAHLTSLHCFS